MLLIKASPDRWMGRRGLHYEVGRYYYNRIPLPSNSKIAEMNMEFGKYLIEEIFSCSPHSTVGLIVVRIALPHW